MSQNKSLVELKDVEFIFKLIRKNILILLIFPIISYLVGYIYTYRLTEIFGSKVQLLLKSNETYDYQDPIYKGLGAYGLYTDVSNQMRILQSKDIISEVVDKMNIDVSYYVVGRLKKKEVFGTLPFRVSVEVINSGLYECPITIKIVNPDSYRLSYELNGQNKELVNYFGEELITEDFKIQLDKNYTIDEKNVAVLMASDYEIQIHTKSFLISKFQQTMSVSNIEFTSILEIFVEDNIEARGKSFLDTLCSTFIDFSMKSQLEINENTLLNIDKQIEEVQKIITNIENELIKYKDDNDILHLSKEEDDYFTKYIDYSQRKRLINENIVSLQSLENYVLTSTDEHLLPPSFFILESDSYLSDKVTEMYEMQIDIKDKIYSYSTDHPTILKLKSDLGTKKKDLLIYIKNMRDALGVKLTEVNNLVGMYKGDIKSLPRSIQGVENIKRELDVNNKMYLFLLEKKTNTLIAKAGIIPQVQIIEQPFSLGIVGPNKKQIINIFIISGLFLGILVALIRKLYFERIESISELSENTTFNVLGGVSFQQNLGLNNIVVDSHPKSKITESFRSIRTNLDFYKGDKNYTSIVVSSFLPSEGKTFCSANIAKLLSNSDKKTIIIDFDLHKPKVHKVFELGNEIGVTTFLTGKNNINAAINKISDNLSIMTSGPIPPNPSELVLKSKVQEIFDFAYANFEYIIIDTPPFGLLNDAIALSKYSNLFVVVMNTKFANRRGVKNVENLIDKNIVQSKAVILNGLKESKLKYYYSKYSYKYGYNYGYNSNYSYTEDYSDND